MMRVISRVEEYRRAHFDSGRRVAQERIQDLLGTKEMFVQRIMPVRAQRNIAASQMM
jgi:hypothetical protein